MYLCHCLASTGIYPLLSRDRGQTHSLPGVCFPHRTGASGSPDRLWWNKHEKKEFLRTGNNKLYWIKPLCFLFFFFFNKNVKRVFAHLHYRVWFGSACWSPAVCAAPWLRRGTADPDTRACAVPLCHSHTATPTSHPGPGRCSRPSGRTAHQQTHSYLAPRAGTQSGSRQTADSAPRTLFQPARSQNTRQETVNNCKQLYGPINSRCCFINDTFAVELAWLECICCKFPPLFVEVLK